MPAIKIAIFDDHPIIASGIIGYLAQYPEQINTFFAAHTRPDLHANISAHPPDVLILDVVAPDVNGLDLFVEVIKTFPKVKIIAYTTLKSPILVENLLLTGVKGFVNKSQPLDELLDAIEEVYNGYISVPQKYKYLTARFRETQNTTLTPREIEIIVEISHHFLLPL